MVLSCQLVVSRPENRRLQNRVLLIAIGFVVALALTFRSSTAYERYIDGIKFYPYLRVSKNRYWQQLIMTTRMFARVIWIHAKEREGELGKEDLLAKLFFPHNNLSNILALASIWHLDL